MGARCHLPARTRCGRTTMVPAVLLAGAALIACGRGPAAGGRGQAALTVLAASSLTAAFTELGAAFEAAHPGTRVSFHFAGSAALARQLEDGAEADVFASADERIMERLHAEGLTETPRTIARNRLVIAVERGNPRRIRGLTDLARPGLVVVLCGRSVPCGGYAADALAAAGVRVEAASREENVKAVVAKVALGEADAGIAYATDVRAANHRVEGVPLPLAEHGVRRPAYPMAITARARGSVLGERWMQFVLGPDGQRVLAANGFEPL